MMKRWILVVTTSVVLVLICAVTVYANLTMTEGTAIDLSSAGAGTDVTITFDPTEITGGTTWDDAGEASVIWTWNLAAGDPAITFGNGVVNISSGALQQGGAAVYYSGGTDVVHEDGGLEADVSAYSGLVAIAAGSTAEVDALSELIAQLADVTAFITDDDMPAAGTDPDVDAAGEIGRDTDGANETGDSSLRGHDGTNQFLYARKLKTIQITLIEPDQIDGADLIPVWQNTSGMTFTVVEWQAWSDDDNVSFELEELTNLADFTAITTIDACEVATNGTSVFYGSDTTITHAAIEHDHMIAIDFDTADTPDYLKVTITGWYNSNVD